MTRWIRPSDDQYVDAGPVFETAVVDVRLFKQVMEIPKNALE